MNQRVLAIAFFVMVVISFSVLWHFGYVAWPNTSTGTNVTSTPLVPEQTGSDINLESFEFLEFAPFEPQNPFNVVLRIEQNGLATLTRHHKTKEVQEVKFIQFSENEMRDIIQDINQAKPALDDTQLNCPPYCGQDNEQASLTVQFHGQTLNWTNTKQSTDLNALEQKAMQWRDMVDAKGGRMELERSKNQSRFDVCACGICCPDAEPLAVVCVDNQSELNQIRELNQEPSQTCEPDQCGLPIIYQVCDVDNT